MKNIGNLDESSNAFLNGSKIQRGEAETETMEVQNTVIIVNYGPATPGEGGCSRAQVVELNIADRVRKEMDVVFAAVGNRVHDAILTSMGSVGTPSVERAVRLITGSSVDKLNSAV